MPPHVVAVSDAEEARVWRILATHPAISLHDHLEVYPANLAEADDWVRDAHPFTGYEGLARSGLAAAFENFGDGTATITSKSGWKWSDVIHDIGIRYADWAHQDFVVRAETIGDIQRRVRGRAGRPHRRARGRDADRERARPARRPVRLRHPDARA